MTARPWRVWFYAPALYWSGWRGLWPVLYGHDEYARRTLCLGWTITGQVVIALWDCGDDECAADRRERDYLQGGDA